MQKKEIMKEKNKIHIVIGTKAQLIKMAPIIHELEKRKIPYNFIFTGQHKETIDDLRENFSIKKPDITLYEGKDITGIFQMFFWIIRISLMAIFKKKKIFGKTEKKDILLTHGDTFSTVLGAIMGKLAGIKVGHVESGLRSFHLFHPFPEELNRLITFRLSNYYFCPGEWAINNLKKYKGHKINTKLNTLYDSLQLAIKESEKATVKIPEEKFCIFSIHRFENIFKTDQFKKILKELEETAKSIKVLFILHPPTKKQLEKLKLMEKLINTPNIELRPRYDYFNFINLLSKSEFIITDGGSNQEECFYLGKPCLLMRKTTEREEGLNQNVLISKYDTAITKEFIKNYQKYRIPQNTDTQSPTTIIINTITE